LHYGGGRGHYSPMTNPEIALLQTDTLAEHLAALRGEILAAGFEGFLVPMADEYQSEYVPPSARRVAFLTGFTGSAGTVVVLKDKAGFFTDSRYTLQATKQVPSDLFTVFDSAEKSPYAWLEENIGKGAKLGYDPWLHTGEAVERLKKALAKSGAEAVAATQNLVDHIWHDRPSEPAEPVVLHDIAYAGKTSVDKRQALAEELRKRELTAAIITDPASVAWLLNVRGNDVANTPLPLSRAILRDNGAVQWFIDRRKVTEGLQRHVGEEVTLSPPDQFAPVLEQLAKQGKSILLDPAHASSWIVEHLKAFEAKIENGEDICELPKACKNFAELDGMRAAHRRDGAALVRFLAWLDQTWPGGNLTEMSAEHKLASFRETNNNYRGPSFDTISGFGEHGAIVHYKATHQTDKHLKAGTLYLLDSGGQYLDGTTDVTRTLALGTPTAEMRDRFTRVLKGHIALASIRFPEGTTGAELDVLARQYLWEIGMDYGHGTGHGVGCYLSVHEGPQAISKRSKVPLKPGMVLSNEPGYYKAGAYGIRIENLQAVVEILGITGSDKKLFGFETLTLVPIDRRAVEVSMLTDAELKWLNAYHLRVRQVLRSMVDESSAVWLEAATLPIDR
jgi:Xaa-Pro aminopeptidase